MIFAWFVVMSLSFTRKDLKVRQIFVLNVNYMSTKDTTKNQEAVSMINDLLELTRSILQECDKDPDLNDLAIKYLLNQKQLLEKLRDILS